MIRFALRRAPRRPPIPLLAFCFWLSFLQLSAPDSAEAKKARDAEELFNPLLGVQWSHWLVGPIAQMADDKEIDAYLRLTSDQEAEAFAETFWAKRNEGTKVFTKTPEELFRERTTEADKRYSEGTYPGSRTARGTVLILYGEPEEIKFESPEKLGYPPLEVWEYAKSNDKGLDGKKPKKRYRFVEIKDSTVLYTGQPLRTDPRARLRARRP